ncbi:TIGR03089 family protein [Cryptosporangium sp. NPDC048952]|uniref:TIGR03089 family protein n=1 Tax=Cryptosporangium sp. NPDC048952 TaxID=3363961 RepID=UPI00371CB1D1
MESPDAALRKALAADPGRPLITQYDDRTGERVELSVATVDNWVSKTANLLQDTGVEPGSTAAVLLPAHWQTAVILLGCWRAGVAVGHSAVPGAVLPADVEPRVVFTAADRAAEAVALGTDFGADEIWALSLAPMAAPLREVPPGVVDYAPEVRTHGDRFTPYTPVDQTGPGLWLAADPPPAAGAAGTAAAGADVAAAGADGAGANGVGGGGLSLAELGALGVARAGVLGLTGGGRLLVGTDEVVQPSPVEWLLAPLVAGGGVVLLRHPDPTRVDHVAETERVTVRLA